MPAIHISDAALAQARHCLDSPAERATLTVHSEGALRALVDAADAARSGDRCSECGRHVGHYPECSQHYSRKRTARPDPDHGCFACSRGIYGAGSEHSCGRWGMDV